jgi:AraC-like DNA-binding protein
MRSSTQGTASSAQSPSKAVRGPVRERRTGTAGVLRGEWAQALLSSQLDPELSEFRRRHGIRPALSEPLCRVPLELVAGVVEDAAIRCADPLLGMRLAAAHRPRGLFHYLMQAETDLRAAVEHLVNFDALVLTSARIRLESRGDALTVVLWPALPARYRPVTQACLAGLAADCRALTVAPIRFTAVELQGVPLAPRRDYEELFACPVRFGAPDNALVCSADTLRTAMARPNPIVAVALAEAAHLEAEVLASASMRQRVTLVVAAMLRSRERIICSDVARRLLSEPAALRRALLAEGVSFGRVCDDVRRALAAIHMEEPSLSLSEVADRCGFASPAAFARAFKRWSSWSPTLYRATGLRGLTPAAA